MITGEMKLKVEQFSYLIFIQRLDDLMQKAFTGDVAFAEAEPSFNQLKLGLV